MAPTSSSSSSSSSSGSITSTISAWSRLTALKKGKHCPRHVLQACSTSSGWQQQQQQQQLVEMRPLAVQQQQGLAVG
jgi:hypothetical protein